MSKNYLAQKEYSYIDIIASLLFFGSWGMSLAYGDSNMVNRSEIALWFSFAIAIGYILGNINVVEKDDKS